MNTPSFRSSVAVVVLPHIYPVGTIIDSRSDGSYIYSSYSGILNLDDFSELKYHQMLDARIEEQYN
jgi:hypothetical protein